MKSLIFLMVAFFISAGHANVLSCGNQLKQIVSGQKVSQTINRQSYIFAAPALKHYRSELRPEFPVSIQSFEKYVLGGKTLGFKVEITDETDEGLVSRL
jgi:hypothetical protein